MRRRRVQPAFLAQCAAEIGDRRIGHVAAEVEQHAVRAEVDDVLGLQILDRRIGAALQQRHPVIIGAHVHAPLVATQVEHAIVDIALGVRIARVDGHLILQPEIVLRKVVMREIVRAEIGAAGERIALAEIIPTEAVLTESHVHRRAFLDPAPLLHPIW